MPRPKNSAKDEIFYPANFTKLRSENAPSKIRTGGRVKKAKVVFDPSENNFPRRRMGRSMSVHCRLESEKSRDLSISPRSRKLRSIVSTQQWPDNSKKSDKSSDRSRSPPILEPQVNDTCMICNKNDMRKHKKLIVCKECCYKVHMSCLKINFQNQNLLEEHWRCDSCTSCVVCCETSQSGNLVTCCICVDAYHLNCHTPKVSNRNVQKHKWECTKCQNINKDVPKVRNSIDMKNGFNNFSVDVVVEIKDQNIEEVLLKLPEDKNKDETAETLSETTNKIKDLNNKLQKAVNGSKNTDEPLPDISDWSCDKLWNYIKKYFPNEAHVFREQEIDGPSLLLMKRSDVIKGLPFKLGPAIRLYSFIVKLQTRSNDPRLTWM